MPVLLPNDIENETPADAVEVEENFNVLEQYTNANIIHRDGSVGMQAPLHLFGDPVGDDDAVRKGYVDALLPIGVILPYAGITVPPGKWAVCNGASVQTALYPLLFQVTGYRFGGSGGNFNLPDMQGRIIIGMLTSDTRFSTTGKKGGNWDVPVPKHRHQIDHNHKGQNTTAAGAHQHAIFRRRQVQGAGDATNNEVAGADKDSGASTNAQVGEAGQHHHAIDLSLIDAWSSYTGTDGAEHVPPYVTVSYVIRVD